MNTRLRRVVLAAALGIALPSTHAADLVTVNGKAPPVMDAVQSAWRELQQADDPKLPAAARLERIAGVRHTAATEDKLRAVFGTGRPYTIERRPGKAGGSHWHAVLQPLHYESAPGSGVDWDEATLDLNLDKAGKRLDLFGKWPGFSAGDGITRMTARGVTMSGRQNVGYRGMWFGERRFTIDSLRIDARPQGTVTMEDLGVDWRTVERPKNAELAYGATVKSLAVGGEKLEDLRFALRLTNIDKEAQAEMDELGQRQRAQAANGAAVTTPAQQFDAMKPYLAAFVKSALRQKTALEIDEISARYHGQKVSVRGRLELAGLVPADLGDLKNLARKIAARFELRIPVAMVREIAGAIAARQAVAMTPKGGTPPDEQSLAQLRASVGDIAVGRIVGDGYATIEDEVVVTTLEYREGKLSANGKEIGLPKAPAPSRVTVTVPDAIGAARNQLPADALQARLIEDSCRLPDYPEEAVRQDLALRTAFTYTVDAEGRVQDAKVVQASGFPDWDRAALDALGRCRYIPALQAGRPIPLEMGWMVKRQAGTTRPQGTGAAP